MRYEIPDENGETRRERNLRADHTSPEIVIPPEYKYLWDWYFSINDTVRRIIDGVCIPIPPTEYVAWQHMTGEVIRPCEISVLLAMDKAYVSEVNVELAAYRERQDAARNKK